MILVNDFTIPTLHIIEKESEVLNGHEKPEVEILQMELIVNFSKVSSN